MERVTVDILKEPKKKLTAVPRGKAEGKTTWEVEPGVANLASKYAPPTQQVDLRPREVSLKAGAWTYTLDLPPIGGERFTVRAHKSGSSAANVHECEVVTERVVPLSVYVMDEAGIAAWRSISGAFDEAYRAVGIRFDIAAPVKVDRTTFRLTYRNGKVDLRPDVEALFASKTLPPVAPGTLRLFVLHELTRIEDKSATWSNQSASSSPPEKVVSLQEGETVKVRSARLEVGGRSYDLTDDPYVDGNKIKFPAFDWGRIQGIALKDGATGKLTIDYGIHFAGLGGMSEGERTNLAVFATRFASGKPIPKEVTLRLAIHEVAHALMQVEATRNATVEHPDRLYFLNGPHCNTNLDSKHRPVEGKNTCVMYHDATDADQMDAAFCDDCKVNLRMLDLRLTGVRRVWTL